MDDDLKHQLSNRIYKLAPKPFGFPTDIFIFYFYGEHKLLGWVVMTVQWIKSPGFAKSMLQKQYTLIPKNSH